MTEPSRVHAHILRARLSNDLIERVKHLLDMHYEELATHKDQMILKPDWDRYLAMQEEDKFFVLTAWVDGELVGYHGFFVTSNLHYSDLYLAASDVLYIHPDHRNSSVSGRIMQESVKYAREIGAAAFIWRAKPGTALDNVLKRRHPPQDNSYYQTL